ncbi:MAG: putative porin [Pseudomonadota bacterium]
MNKKTLLLAMTLGGLLSQGPAQAGEREDLEALRATTLAIVDALVDKGILTKEAAQELVKQAEKKGQEQAAQMAKAEGEAGVVRVTYIPEPVKRELREQLRQEMVAQAKNERWGDVNAVPEWLDRIKWEGDFRLRYQHDGFDDGNATPFALDNILTSPGTTGAGIDNTTEARDRMRVRARLGMLAKVSSSVSAGFRIATGNTGDPVSTNQTLGNHNNKYSLVLDRAYGVADPWEWLSVSGGRIPNPFFSTDLVWDDDLNFDGLAATFKPWSRANVSAKPFLTLGAFPLQEVESAPTNLASDKWLYAAQLGVDWRVSSFSRWRVGLAYYDYRNLAGVRDSVTDGVYLYGDSATGARQKGNTVFELAPADSPGLYGLASDYRLVNLTAMADLGHFDPLHVILSADVVKNIGYDEARVAAMLGSATYERKDLGWQAKLTLGHPAMDLPGNWQIFAGYRYLERDAVLDAFTDSDFHLGGTDSQGYFIGGMYALDRNSWMGLKWLSANEIDGLPFAIDVLQLDFNAKF